MAFASARGNKALENDSVSKEADAQGRFNLRGRNGDSDLDRLRNGRGNPLQRRGDGEQDTEGWSTVKPRKSFGHEGAERFHGKMGGNYRDERRPVRDRDNGDATRDRATRTFDGSARDKEADETDGRARNGPGRGKLDLWYRNDNEAPTPEKRERGDKMRSWRDRDPHPEPSEDRSNARTQDRRWGRDRDQRVEREPEWLDEPNEGQREAHTQQDFQKWMEQMKKAKSNPSGAAAAKTATNEIAVDGAAEAAAAFIEAEKPLVQSAPAVELGPDKFFMAFGPPSANTVDVATPGEQKDPSGKSKAAGKSSRFTSFFAQPQEDIRGRTEPPTPIAGPLLNLLAGPNPNAPPQHQAQPQIQPQIQHHQAAPPEEERQAFQQLLAKLQKQSMSATPPAMSPFAAPGQPQPGNPIKAGAITSPEPFQQYGVGVGEGLGRPPSQHVQEILAPRPQPQARPEQLLQDLVGHHQRTSSQGSGRPEGVARNNSNTEFLMNLMRAGPDAQRPDQHMMRMPQPQKQQQVPTHLPQLNEREPDFARDNRSGHPRQMRPQPPPGFPMDDSFHNHEQDAHQRPPNQPTQILQRPPPPPGLDQMPPNWMPGGAQMPPPPPGPQQQRGPMMPPPGLAGGPGGPGRNVPMPHMFPPNFPPGAMPPPEVMGGMPPRNMPPPPPGFFNGPPHGFIPPGLAGFNGPPVPGPDAHVYAGGPFEGRGMPPPGNPGRGAAYGRL